MKKLKILFLLLLVTSSQAKTLIVDPSGSGDAKTLSDAIALASAGDKIDVKPGIYGGTVVDRTVSIFGSGQAEISGESALVVIAPGCRISNLSVDFSGLGPAVVLKSPDNILIRCSINGATTGISIVGKNNSLLENEIDSGLGLELLSSECRILNNTFRGDNGIKMISASGNVISGCKLLNARGIESESSVMNKIANNSFSGMGFGVVLLKSADNWLSGNNLSGPYVSGLDVVESSGNNLFGNSIVGCKLGISLRRSENNSLNYNEFQRNERAGIYMDGSFKNKVEGNELSGNGNGILLTSSGENLFKSNNASTNTYGISLRGSVKNVLRNNTMSANVYNIRVDAGEVSSSSLTSSSHDFFLQDIDSSNLVDTKPICYLVGKSNMGVPPGCGFIALISCRNVKASNQTISNSSAGILVVNTTAFQVRESICSRNEVGIYLVESKGFVGNCNASECRIGFMASGSSDSLFEKDVAGNCSEEGFRAEEALNLTWRNCSVQSCAKGMYLVRTRLCNLLNCSVSWNKDVGIMLIDSHKCLLKGNMASMNERGIALSESNSCRLTESNASMNRQDGYSLEQLSGTEVRENIAKANKQGLFVQSSKRLRIEGNNLSENSRYGLRMSNSMDSNITENGFIRNKLAGVNLVDCSGNLFYHNIFVENGLQNAADNGENDWDAGPEIGGNYWSDHAVQGNPSNQPRQIPSKGVDQHPYQEQEGWR